MFINPILVGKEEHLPSPPFFFFHKIRTAMHFFSKIFLIFNFDVLKILVDNQRSLGVRVGLVGVVDIFDYFSKNC